MSSCSYNLIFFSFISLVLMSSFIMFPGILIQTVPFFGESQIYGYNIHLENL